MPSSPARPPRPPPKPRIPTSPRRTQSYGNARSPPLRPPPVRRHTTQTQRPASSPRPSPARSPTTSRQRSQPPPARAGKRVLIPVPIRTKDAESPMYVRAPSGQHIDFVFPAPKKRGILGRLLDSVEWGAPGENKPFRYRKPGPKQPFYKRLMS